MTKLGYNKAVGVAIATTLVLCPAAVPVLSSASSNVTQPQPILTNSNHNLPNEHAINSIFAPLVEHDYKYRYALADLYSSETVPVNPPLRTEHAPIQRLTPVIHPVYHVPATKAHMNRHINDPDDALTLDNPRITNVQGFNGPNYGRIVIDLSRDSGYTAKRIDEKRVVIRLTDTCISPSLEEQTLTLGESGLIQHIALSTGSGNDVVRSKGAEVAIEFASKATYSVLRLSEPARIVIELNKVPTQPSQTATPASDNHVGTAVSSVTAQSSQERRFVDAGDKEPSSGDSPSDSASAVKDNDKSISEREKLVSWQPDNTPRIGDQLKNGIPNSISILSDKTRVLPGGAVNRGITTPIEPRHREGLIKCIVIDAGHGGHDPGAMSQNGILEKEIVLDIAQRLKSYLQARYPDVRVILTRDSDFFITLGERVAIANRQGADLFLSIHANASESPAASGVEIYYVNQTSEALRASVLADSNEREMAVENSTGDEPDAIAQTANSFVRNRLKESEDLARHLQSALVGGISSGPQSGKDRGVKQASFTVLLGTKMPGVLAEVSFLSNPHEADLLRSSQFRDRIAASLLSGLEDYLQDRSVEAAPSRK